MIGLATAGQVGYLSLVDDATREAILASHATGATMREITSAHRVSHQTVTRVTSTGLPAIPATDVTTWQQEATPVLESIMRRQLRQYSQALDDGKIAPAYIPVHYGILQDKHKDLNSVAASALGPSDPAVHDILSDLKGLSSSASTVNVQVNVQHVHLTEQSTKPATQCQDV